LKETIVKLKVTVETWK